MDNNISVAIIACVKQEELYIKEWLDYHISIGVDNFYLCDNNDSDYSPKLTDVVKEYIDKGIVNVFDYNNVFPIQPSCYTDIYDNYGDLHDWFAIIDIDEFIDIPAFDNNIKKFLNSKQIKNKNYIGLLWRYYGDNDLLEYDGRGCLERFTEPATSYKLINNEYKYIIIDGKSGITKSIVKGKKNEYWEKFLEKHGEYPKICHQHAAFKKYKDIQRYDVLGNKMLNITRIKQDIYFYFFIKKIYNYCYIKHFATKTIQEYIDLKMKKGSAVINLKDGEPYKCTLGNFFGLNQETPEKQKYLLEKYGIVK